MRDTVENNVSDQFRKPGTFFEPKDFSDFLNYINNIGYYLSGFGGQGNIIQNFLSRLDRHGTVLTPLNSMNKGYTFITRPRLNLTSGNLKQHPVLSTLNSLEPQSVPFMIRGLLDTRLSKGEPLFRSIASDYQSRAEAENFRTLAEKSGLLDIYNPFLTPLCNGLKGISGFPDFTINEETTEGDFHSGDFTFIKGGDMNNKTQELSLEFRDIQGSIILSIIYYWCLYMALQAKGVVMSYQDDIYEQRLNYTVSIYRFVMDTTRQQILWWSKATGCFPKSAPVGALFNITQGEPMITSAMNFSIPFVANKVEYNDPGILLDFNRLMRRYALGIDYQVNDDTSASQHLEWTPIDDTDYRSASANFIGLPYIAESDDAPYSLQLQWRTSARYSDALMTRDKYIPKIQKWEKELLEQKNSTLNQLGMSTSTEDYETQDNGYWHA